MKILNLQNSSLREIFWILTILGIILFPCFALNYCSMLIGKISL